ncbi:translation initiation factor IF-2 [Ligilactobacillus sp. LYQ139]|uniref:translation initiation factor IF-2 n=1 Tax=Ligilactobacillus sp. LYQ139 TaxID=3378800 RepID=UPI0038530B63
MSKKRIYELAKELNVASKEVLQAAKSQGIKVGNHMSAVTPDEEQRIRTAMKPATKKKAVKPAVKKRSAAKKVTKKPANSKIKTAKKKSSTKPSNQNGKATPQTAQKKRPQATTSPRKDRQQGEEESSYGRSNRDRQNDRKFKQNGKRTGNNNRRFGNNQNRFSKKNRKNKKFRKQQKKQPATPRKNKPLPDTLVYTVGMNVADIAKKIHREPAEIIKKLFMLGVMVNQNQSLDKDTIEILADEYGIKAEEKVEVDVSDIDKFFEEEQKNTDHLESRPPVVTIMGHVDHGKTTLLDKLRHSNITAGEAGGITQHIGAYQIKRNGKTITFLDTPGHAAFTNMRARGADVTDITVLVVAADDGVMPQTIEAINHSKAAGVPIIVAVNKIDKPGANPDHVMEQLTEYELIPEDWGGDTIFVNISAKFGKNIDDLLDMILLESEMLELKANPDQHGAGSVIEARLDKGRGSVATLLVQQGTLHVGDPIVVGNTYGRIRTMTDAYGKRVKKATPAMPVEITGLNDVPESGDRFITFDDEKTARAAGEERAKRALMKERSQVNHVTLDNLFDTMKENDMKKVDLIIKADVQGSVEALAQSFQKIDVDGVRVNIIHQAVGAINESDVTLAEASNAIIIGFNVRPTPLAKAQAESSSVDIRLHNVIYKAIDEVETAMKGMLEPVYKEKVTGQVEVRKTIKVSKLGTIAGSYVTDGVIKRNSGVRLIRNGIVIYDGKLSSLKRFKDDVKEVKAGYECGLMIENYNDIKVGDQIEAYVMEEIPVDQR